MPPRLSVGSLCSRCVLRQRNLSSMSFAQKQADLPPPPPEAGHVRLTNRALISLTGVDSTAFLQGLITQNVVTPKNRASLRTPFYAGFLNAQGRLLHDAFIYPTLPEGNEASGTLELGYFIEVDREQVPNLLKHFMKHKLRAKLNFRALDEGERDVWAAWDNAGNWEMKESGGVLKEAVLSCADKRAPGFGYRLLASGGDLRRLRQPLPGEEVPLAAYTLRRFLHGIPEGQNELVRESALPMDSNMDVMGGIDFHKGCYLGQELTIRTHHRGVIRKRILPVQLYNIDDAKPAHSGAGMPVYSASHQVNLPPVGANITKSSASGKGRSAGRFISGIGNVGLALCRLETMTDISLTGESSQYNPDEDFKISWEADVTAGAIDTGEVKVKAFVLPWVKEYILNGGVRQRTTKEDVQRAKDRVEQIEEDVRS
ncbi:ccr4 associated factor [Emydomyces testavorans]|uniref:Iron-sulfur cluster assembly factor IBA57 homolog, mitochondrial n=1 Tax=Emydomyces testavorans TaxID=2070801 RepID=A0AAF0DMB6_9EURO|nr:ccr4 associated factor [Emydomyces testavorans]